ncbi:MAG: hypothetical protein AAB800_03920 [Patescibacteria group bacterium]
MDTLLTPPLTLLKQAWSLALSKSNRLTYMTLGAIPVVLSFGFSAITSYFITTSTDLETVLTNFLNSAGVWGVVGIIALVLIGIVFAVFIGTWYTALLYKIYQSTALNKPNSLSLHLHPSRLVILRLFITSLKVGLLATFGFLLLIIPGIIITVRYAFAPLIAVTEEKVMNPLAESKQLAQGRFWQLLRRSVIPFIFYSVPLSVFQAIHPILGSIWSLSSPIFGLYFYLVFVDFKRTATPIA